MLRFASALGAVVLTNLICSTARAQVHGEEPPNVKLTDAASRTVNSAVGLLDVTSASSCKYLTVVCVHPEGYFLARQSHAYTDGTPYRLVLNPGTRDEQVVQARVVRRDDQRQLSLLKADVSGRIPATQLGSVITKPTRVFFLRFDPPADKPKDVQVYPRPAIEEYWAGRLITQDGRLNERLTFKAVIARFRKNNEGAIDVGIDEEGQLAAMVDGTTVETMRQFLLAPELSFRPLPISYKKAHEPHELELRPTWFLDPVPTFRASLVLGREGEERFFVFRSQGESRLVARAAPSQSPLADNDGDRLSPIPYEVRLDVEVDKSSAMCKGALTVVGPEDPPAALGPVEPQFAGETLEIPLPGTVKSAMLAGGGRWLLLHLAGLQQIGVLDVSAGKLVGHLSLNDMEDPVWAASAEKLVIMDRNKPKLVRWDIASRSREATALLRIPIHQADISMGFASCGPLLVYGMRTKFVDLESLQVIPTLRDRSADLSARLTSTADGTIFLPWITGGNRYPGQPEIKLSNVHAPDRMVSGYPGGHLGPDGKQIYSAFGLCDNTMPLRSEPSLEGMHCVATASTDLFLKLEYGENKIGNDRKADDPCTALCLYSNDPRRQFVRFTRTEMPELGQFAARDYTGLVEPRTDRRLFCLPQANLIITLTSSLDRIVIRRLAVTQHLRNAKVDYLLVDTYPLPQATRGQTYAYQPRLRSSHPPVAVHLVKGPGEITDSGTFVWKVPADFKDRSTTIGLSFTDRHNTQRVQQFEVRVR